MFAVGVRSEQAIVHLAPPPSILRFVLNSRISFFSLVVKLFGPLLRQNLEREKKCVTPVELSTSFFQ